MNMQIQPALCTHQNTLFWCLTALRQSYIHPTSQRWVRGVCLQLLTAPLFHKTKKACIILYVGADTLNFGTGRSVSLYLVQRRPILGSRTMSTGGIPGFCRRGRGETQYCYPSHNFTWRELVAKQFYTNRTRCLTKMNTSDTPFKMLEHARWPRQHSHIGTYHGGRLLGYYCSRLAAANAGPLTGMLKVCPS